MSNNQFLCKDNTDDLISNLKKIVHLFNKNRIHFWMYGGALLGYVRSKELIPWNKDIDLFVWSDEYPKVLGLKYDFKKLGFEILVQENSMMLFWGDKNISIAYYTLQGNNAIWDKLCTRNKLGNMIYYGLLCKAVEYKIDRLYRFLKWFLLKTGGCYLVRQKVPSHFYHNLKEIDFFGVKLKVPAETEDYFEYAFGKNWKIPLKDFQYRKEYIQVIYGSKPNDLRYHSDSIKS